VLPSSFAVGTAAQVSTAAAALAAPKSGGCATAGPRTLRSTCGTPRSNCCAFFTIDGKRLELWDKLAGLYRCSDGWVRLHTNFAHHRDGVLRLLGLPEGAQTPRSAVADALASLAGTGVRTGSQRCRHGRRLRCAASTNGTRIRTGAVLNAQPLVAIERIGDAPPLDWPPLPAECRPLEGLRVLD
jgi:hypothetical protein